MKVYLAKLDKTDLSLISYAYLNSGDSYEYRPYAMKKVYNGTSENGFILAGVKVDAGIDYGYIVKVDNSFNIEHEYVGVQYSRFNSVAPVYASGTNPDGTPVSNSSCTGYVAAGYDFNSDFDIYAVGLGTTLSSATWTQTIASTYSGSSPVVENATCTGSGTASSGTQSGIGPLPDPTINCSSTISNWSIRDISTWHALNNHTDKAYSIAQLHDGSFMIAGEFDLIEESCDAPSVSPVPPITLCYSDYKSDESVLIKLNSSGTVTKILVYNVGGGGDLREKFKELDAANSWDIVALSNTTDAGMLADSRDHDELVLFRFDASLTTTRWTKAVSSMNSIGDDCTCAFAMDITSDGGYIIGGNDGANNDDMVFVKLGGECQNPSTYLSYPLPTSSQTLVAGTDAAYTGYATNGSDEGGVWHIASGVNITMTGYKFNFMDTKMQNDFYNITLPTNITIDPGGSLTLINCTLRNFQGCDANDMWDGIILGGASGASQSPSSNQGVLVLTDCTVENARTGVDVQGGGILTVNKSSSGTAFTNCQTGINFETYGTHGTTNSSAISYATFNCTGALKGYNGAGTLNHIMMTAVHNPTIVGNHFKYDYATAFGFDHCNGQGTGINALISDLDLSSSGTTAGACTFSSGDANTFENLDYGVYSDKSPFYTADTKVWLSRFTNCRQGITVNNAFSGDVVDLKLNYFSYTDVLQTNEAPNSTNHCASLMYSGIRLFNCNNFDVWDNRLHIQPSISAHNYEINAIWASQSGGDMVFPSNIFWNEFLNESAISTSGSAGANSYGIREDDNRTDMTHNKFINIYGNGDPNNTGFLNNLDDWYIDDPGFTQTPVNTNGVVNSFGTAGGSYTDKNIYNINPFNYIQVTGSATPVLHNNTPPAVSSNGNDLNGTTTHFTDFTLACVPAAPLFNLRPYKASLKVIPNPFQNNAAIIYFLPVGCQSANLEIYDGLGRHVNTLELTQDMGGYCTLDGTCMKPGVYHYRLKSDKEVLLTDSFIISSN